MVLVSVALALLWWFLLSKLCGLTSLSRSLDRASGHLLEIGLFKDHPRTIFKVFGSVVKHSFVLLKQLFLPCLVFLIPFVPLVGMVASRYAVRPLRVEESVIISGKPSQANLELPENVVLEAGPIVDAKTQAKYWRVSASNPGLHYLRISSEEGVPTELTLRVKSESLNLRVWPFTSKDAVIHYPERTIWLADYQVHWGVPFFLLFLLAAGLTRRLFR